MKVPRSEYGILKMSELMNAILGHREAEEHKMRDNWERTRLTIITLANVSGNLKQPLKTSDIPFAWDGFNSKLTDEDWAYVFEQGDRMFTKGHTIDSWEAKGKKDLELERKIKKLNG